jgi:putative membrane protein
MFPRMYHGFFPGLGGGEWLIMILCMAFIVAVIIGIVLLVTWLVRRSSSSGRGASALQTPPNPPAPSAREILQTRYARGEITREQYQEMLADLNQTPTQ